MSIVPDEDDTTAADYPPGYTAVGEGATAAAAIGPDLDGDLAGLKAVKDGTLDATMTQRTQFMGKLALQSALDLVAGKKVPAEQLQDAALTTKDNVDQYIAEHP